jgi:hypothetical protein
MEEEHEESLDEENIGGSKNTGGGHVGGGVSVSNI